MSERKLTDQEIQDISYRQTWQPLLLLNTFRLLLVILLAMLFVISRIPINADWLPEIVNNIGSKVGSSSVQLFLASISSYFLVSAIEFVTIARNWPTFRAQTVCQIILDILLLTLLMHSSGGVQSGLGMLLIISISAGAVLLRGQVSLFLASIACLAVMFEHYVSSQANPAINFDQPALLCAAFLGVAMLGTSLSRRVAESERLAYARGQDLQRLQQLNQMIIQNSTTGMLVVDEKRILQTMNESAWLLLNMPSGPINRQLSTLSVELDKRLTAWLAGQPIHTSFRVQNDGADLVADFKKVVKELRPSFLVFINDITMQKQSAQEQSLASLGQLTAGIAHEIRNPLAAISHAAQLLAESPDLLDEDKHFTDIIQRHSQRVNRIIENVMQLSRRSEPKKEWLKLDEWLQAFCDDLPASTAEKLKVTATDVIIDLQVEPKDTRLLADPVQLVQILTNLCENGLRHSLQGQGICKISIMAGIRLDEKGVVIDVIDHGSGIAADSAEKIFDPFYTSESTGTGLGLYIARKLSQVNGASLSYRPITAGGSCFRIRFRE
ncbi:sensor histidine kinase [Pelagibaculum spongiae]|nr:ATP-binding protein [Pelagibaculum spongiae]